MSRTSIREETLFADALAQPSAERGAFLVKACAANVDLLARLVALVGADEGGETHLRGFAPSRQPHTEEGPGTERRVDPNPFSIFSPTSSDLASSRSTSMAS